jgi:hypothetical protein
MGVSSPVIAALHHSIESRRPQLDYAMKQTAGGLHQHGPAEPLPLSAGSRETTCRSPT